MCSLFAVDQDDGFFVPEKDGKIFANLQDLPTKAEYPGNRKMNTFMTFLHKYAANMYSSREIKTFKRENPSNALID